MLSVSIRLCLLGVFLSCTLTGCALPAPPPPLQQRVPIAAQPVNTDDRRAPVHLPTVTPEQAASNGPSADQQALLARLRNAGPAPEVANEVWLNSQRLKLADLRGKVVMVEFWTYGCI